MDAARPIFTIGHSSQAPDDFCALLGQHQISVLVDVRSYPYSKYATQFNRETLKAALTERGVRYAYLGDELGGRPQDERFYDETGRVDYAKLAEAEFFLRGIARLEKSRAAYRLALLCSEEDPGGCHRRLLIGRVLAGRGVEVRHIRGSGDVQSEADLAAQQGETAAEA